MNQLFNDKIKTGSNKINLDIGQYKFDLLHVRAEDVSINGNKLFLCAHNRLVDTKDLDRYITDLDREIYQKSGFWYIGVLTGTYLDENVDMNRLSFSIPEGGIAEDMISPLSMDQIMSGVIEQVQLYLKDYLQPIAESKDRRIKQYVIHQAPQFRHLLKYKPSDINAIKPNLSDEKLDDELHKIKREFDKEVKEQNKLLLNDLNDGHLSTQEYQERYQKQVEKVSHSNSAVLAEYVAHRRVIIDLLDFAIKKSDSTGKFHKEKYIHDLIYPTHTGSDEMVYDKHNLWLIDEKLAYCNYISSDIPFNNDQSEERPDILVLDNPVAMSESENDGTEFDTIILFELKRPMRDDYTDSENPIIQLYDYVDKIKSGKAKDRYGRYIKTSENTRFYMYVLSDVTPKLERIIKRNGFSQTPDKLGFYDYNDIYKTYVEVIPFNKIINDARKRNRVLFDKLGL